MGLTREELLEAAPEGVTYVYVERVEDPTVGFQTFWHDGRWHTSLWNSPHCTTMDFWDAQAIDVGETVSHAAGELSRRFAAQFNMLCDWAKDLGLESELIGHVADGLGLEAGGGIITLTPRQQEDRPRLALEFLKEHFKKITQVRLEFENNSRTMQAEKPDPGRVPRGTPESSLSIKAWLADSGYYDKPKNKPRDPWGEEVDKRGY